MNKRLSLFLALMVTASLSLGTVMASAATTEGTEISTIQAATLTGSVGNVTGAVGATVIVPVTINAATTPIDSALFTVKYDTTKLQAVGATAGALVTSASTDFTVNAVTGGVIVMWSDETTTGARAIKTNGVIVNVSFKILASGTSAVSLTDVSLCDTAAVEVTSGITAGSVTSGGGNATISPTSGTMAQGTPLAASFAMTLNGTTPLAVYNGTTKLVNGSHFKVIGSSVYFNPAYMATLPVGTTTFTLDVSSGVDPTLTVTVTGGVNATINPTSVTFTKGSTADTSFTMTLNGRKPLNMYVGTYKLIYGTDWTLSGNVVTIKKSLLATAPVGTSTIRLDVDAGVDPIFSIIVR